MSEIETVIPRMPTAPTNRQPDNAVDCHSHVFGPYDRYSLVNPPNYAPPQAPVERHLAMLDTVGNRYGVLVQPAAYGLDPTLIADAIAASGGRLRGIALGGAELTPARIAELDGQGFKGLRFVDMLDPQGRPYIGAISANVAIEMAPLLADAGWHPELWAGIDHHVEVIPKLIPFGIPIVLDHLAGFSVARGVNDPAFQQLLRFMGDGHVWVKTSLCRQSAAYPRYEELKPFHDALVAANPERLLWGSDWPYLAMGDASPDVGVMIDLVHEWVGDAATIKRIFVDNPAFVYGF
ncbi:MULTISPECIES: amidohydrolase family protein [Sphingobium]|uniref:TIM-barrel fold metal-dependent hydrolase n=1 Tax=Sphingobium lignivorans TaxID=2735886 RepID=A0ABR6NHU7_9SPHN|nr:MULTISPECIES: amidohydrolase family protein [Sphingobium]MBB5986853.1 putative TIM-barrel fold metal-dependent hydrolase [Sphingobium lignivorans]BAK67485.1 putative metal-dependent hydrolase [Sphingobium sp. SYK-6]